MATRASARMRATTPALPGHSFDRRELEGNSMTVIRGARRPSSTSRIVPVAMLAIGSLALGASAHADYLERPEAQAYMDELVAEYGFSRDWLAGVLAKANKSGSVIARMSRPAEKALKWHEYRRIFIKSERIDGGVAFWRRHRATLERAAAEYGVAEQIVVAIIGVETYYGRNLGKTPVLDALATLAFDYPRRAKFFRGQLTEFLLLSREEGMDPAAFTGSYAGAMGFGQFIPSSYRNFAVDFDGDGTRDIWSNETDAIGSVANYFARHDWRGDHPASMRVTLAKPEAAALANTSLDLTQTVGELRQGGVLGLENLAADEPVNLMRMDLADGTEHWLARHDFYVITRYNRSRLYALAVFQLAELIRERFHAAP